MKTVAGALDRPGQGINERHDQVDQRPTDDDVVVGDDTEGSENGRQTDTGKTRVNSTEHTDVTALELLAERELHERYGDTDGEEAGPVGDEEEGTAPLIAQVGETPEVSETDTVADHSEDESHATQPTGSFSALVLIFKEREAAFFTSHVNVDFLNYMK